MSEREPTFEEARAELERIVAQLESGQATLEDALAPDGKVVVVVNDSRGLYDGILASAGLRLEDRVLRPGGRLVLLEHVRGTGSVARWQERMTPPHRRIAGNCHLNRDTLAAVEAAGFETSGVVRAELPGEPALYRAGILGVATRISS